MKIYARLALSIVVLTATLGVNPTASAAPLRDPGARAQVAAILSFCARINPSGRESYRGMARQILGNDELEDASEGSAAYRQAFDAARDAIARVPHAQALQACQAGSKPLSRPARVSRPARAGGRGLERESPAPGTAAHE